MNGTDDIQLVETGHYIYIYISYTVSIEGIEGFFFSFREGEKQFSSPVSEHSKSYTHTHTSHCYTLGTSGRQLQVTVHAVSSQKVFRKRYIDRHQAPNDAGNHPVLVKDDARGHNEPRIREKPCVVDVEYPTLGHITDADVVLVLAVPLGALFAIVRAVRVTTVAGLEIKAMDIFRNCKSWASCQAEAYLFCQLVFNLTK